MMNKLVFVVITTIMLSMASYASEITDKKFSRISPEKMLEIRVQAMTRRLMLGDEAKEKFIPLYKQFLKDLADLRQGCKSQIEGKQETLTDKELDEQFKKYIETNRELISLKDKYYSRFREFLTARQVKIIINSPNFRAPQKQLREQQCRHKYGRHGSHSKFARVKR